MNELEKISQSLGLANIKKHIFICADQTKPKCCSKDESIKVWDYLNKRLSELNLGETEVFFRTKANCLRVCKNGPIMVIYPEGIWYHSVDERMIDKIIQDYIIGGKIVEANLLCLNNSL